MPGRSQSQGGPNNHSDADRRGRPKKRERVVRRPAHTNNSEMGHHHPRSGRHPIAQVFRC
jgi:hypothetical protein